MSGLAMKSFIGVAAVAILIGTPALAADLPVKAPALPVPVYNWTGFYIGGNVGYGGNTADGGSGCVDNNGVTNGPNCQVVPGGQLNAAGFFGGGQIGYNWQVARYVWGIETDIQGSGIRVRVSETSRQDFGKSRTRISVIPGQRFR